MATPPRAGTVTGVRGTSDVSGARSRLHQLFMDGRFVVTAELGTTDSADPASVHEVIDPLRGNVDA